MFKFKAMERLVAGSPVLQFSKKAAQLEMEPVSLSDTFSPTGISFGMGQELTGNSDVAHSKSIKQHRLSLNMMKFDMQQRSE